MKILVNAVGVVVLISAAAALATPITAAPSEASAVGTPADVSVPLASTLLFGPIGPTQAVPRPQLTNPQAEPGRVPRTRVGGVVVNVRGGVIARAAVRLIGSPFVLTTVADTAGRFVFVDVPPGQYLLEAERVGFITSAMGAPRPGAPGQPLVIAAGASFADLRIGLTPQGVVAGRVVNQEGEPLVRAQVTVHQVRYVRGHRKLAAVGSDVTDDKGDYRIANIAPGQYYVSAGAPSEGPVPTFLDGPLPTSPEAIRAAGYAAGHAAARRQNGTLFPPADADGVVDVRTFYPASQELAGAVMIDITAGLQLHGLDVQVGRERVASIRGRVVGAVNDTNGVVVVAERVLAAGALGEGVSTVTRDGQFEFADLPPGTYSLHVPANASNVAARAEVVVAGADTDDVVLSLAAAVPLTGMVRIEASKMAAAMVVERLRLRLLPQEEPSAPIVVIVGTDQTLETSRALAPGRYQLDVTGLPADLYVKSVHYGGEHVTSTAIPIGSDSARRLEIVVSAEGATATGVVRDQQGRVVAGETVTIWPRQLTPWSSTSGVVSIVTDQSGSFRASGLAPGDYLAMSWEGEPANSGLLQSPEFLSRFAGEAQPLVVRQGALVTVAPPRVAASRVAGVVAQLP